MLMALTMVATVAAMPERKPLTIEDIWAVRRVGTPALSPDGRRAAYTVTAYDMAENKGDGDLWIVPVAGGAPRRLTTSKASDTSPVWSPDGSRLAFLSRREGDSATQLYVIPVDGGEAERLTDMPLSVSAPRWFPDGRRLAFVSHVIASTESPEATRKALEAREKSKVKARVTEDRLFRFWDRWLTDDEYPRLFVVDVESRKVTDLLPGSRRYFDFESGSGSYDISPDGTRIAFAANATEAPYKTVNSDVFVVPAGGGEVRDLTSDNAADDTDPVWSPDGRSIAYGRESRGEGWPDRVRLAVLDAAGGAPRVLTEAWDVSPKDWQWTRDGRALVFTAETRARTGLFILPLTGGTPRLLHAGGTVAGPRLTASLAVFQLHDLDHPPELAAVSLDGTGFRRLTTTNDALMARIDLGPVKDVTFKGAGDEDVQMFVVHPPGFDPKRKYPLVQMVHGGPVGTSPDGFSFRWNAHAFAAPGYVVALVNFHGSSSFGQKWVESILGAHPDKPFTDVMKATDHLIGQGYVDPDRLAAAGGSYGGFLVDWIEGHTDRFKCLISHAGVYDLLGQSASDSYYGRQHSYGGYPFTNLENIERWSPNRYAAAFKTPMLVLHGEKDFRVPVTQGLELYGVLQSKGVPSRLVYYTEENHWILKPQDSRHWYGEVLGWLARWLGPAR